MPSWQGTARAQASEIPQLPTPDGPVQTAFWEHSQLPGAGKGTREQYLMRAKLGLGKVLAMWQ